MNIILKFQLNPLRSSSVIAEEKNGWTDGQTDRQMDRWADGQMDRPLDKQNKNIYASSLLGGGMIKAPTGMKHSDSLIHFCHYTCTI